MSTMQPADLRAWRKRLGLTQALAAEALRVGKRAVEYWEAGEREIPGPVTLACELLEAKT